MNDQASPKYMRICADLIRAKEAKTLFIAPSGCTLHQPENLRRWTLPQCYSGAQWEGYYAAPVGQSRESDALERSNWRQQWKALQPFAADFVDADGDGVSPCIVRESHWAVGWVEWVAIHETNEAALRAADELAGRLENYPILSEDDFSAEEQEEAETVWRDCYSAKERIAWIRRHRSQFEPQSFADLLGCARGRYFIGYASALLR